MTDALTSDRPTSDHPRSELPSALQPLPDAQFARPRWGRAGAIYDLIVTVGFATPFTAALMLDLTRRAHEWFDLPGAEAPTLGPFVASPSAAQGVQQPRGSSSQSRGASPMLRGLPPLHSPVREPPSGASAATLPRFVRPFDPAISRGGGAVALRAVPPGPSAHLLNRQL